MKSISLLILLLPFLVLAQRQKVNNFYEETDVTYNGDIFSGYLETDIVGREHFYMFYKSQNASNKLFIMFFGGPACSVFTNIFTETGPVIAKMIDSKATYSLNEHSWNKDLNILYIESPAGVGFSKTDTLSTFYNDQMVVTAHYASLKKFLELFPEHKSNEFYFGGESYVGVYVPFLMKEIYDRSELKLDIKGILIGDGYTDSEIDGNKEIVDYGYNNGLISIELKKTYDAECPEIPYPNSNRLVTVKCNEIRREIQAVLGGIDMYGIYNRCENKQPSTNSEAFNQSNEELVDEILIRPPACNEDATYITFLNKQTTKLKLHVDTNIQWKYCNSDIQSRFRPSSSLPIYEKILMSKGIKVWFYSGSADGIMPTLGTMRWLRKTGWKTKTDFAKWKYNGQVGGFYQIYENDFTFITVRGAGHLAVEYKKPEMKYILDSFIAGKML